MTISPAGSYVAMTTPVRGDHPVDQLQAGRDRAVGEQPLAGPDDDREDPQAEFVDEVVLQQRLDQVAAAMHLQFGPVAPS